MWEWGSRLSVSDRLWLWGPLAGEWRPGAVRKRTALSIIAGSGGEVVGVDVSHGSGTSPVVKARVGGRSHFCSEGPQRLENSNWSHRSVPGVFGDGAEDF